MSSHPGCSAAVCLLFLTISGRAYGERDDSFAPDFRAPEHEYWNRPLNDPFSDLKGKLEEGDLDLDFSSEKRFLSTLLKELDISPATQMLVYSTTSLQLSKISPRTPRALYFNESIYLGYVQGGKIEIVSIDPELGGIFYIFDIPRPGERPVAERSRRCMHCHSGEDTFHVPGIVIKSVMPGPRGGSLDSFRRAQSGHNIPLRERFGGWHVTGAGNFEDHRGNLTGRFTPDGIVTTPLPPGQHFDWDAFPVATSDLLAHLLHEHQAGFVNRVVRLQYRLRNPVDPQEGIGTLDLGKEVDMLTRYLLFSGESALPEGGIIGDARLKEDFLSSRRANSSGDSLKDFDLRTKVFRNRCSYMIYTPLFQKLPDSFKQLVYIRLARALSPGSDDPAFSHLLPEEKMRIKEILGETLTGLPENW